MSDSRRILYSSPLTSTSEPPYLPKITSSPIFTESSPRLPESSNLPGPVAITLPRCGFSWAASGSTMPPAVICSASRVSTTTRSSRGRNLILDICELLLFVVCFYYVAEIARIRPMVVCPRSCECGYADLRTTSCRPCHPFLPCRLPFHPFHRPCRGRGDGRRHRRLLP